jgi:hypothetical protein
MPWNPNDETVKEVIDANIRVAGPNQNGINTPETVKQLFTLYWNEIKGQVATAVDAVEEPISYNNTVGF